MNDSPVPVVLWTEATGNAPSLGQQFRASLEHAFIIMTRRRRFALAAALTFLPALVPIMESFFGRSVHALMASELFTRLAEKLFIDLLSPLLGLFFATLLIAEDVELRTISYILTRPISRTAWVLGRFTAFLMAAAPILLVSLTITALACGVKRQGFVLSNVNDFWLFGHYVAVQTIALAAYGAFALFLGAFSRRPIVYGVLLIYGWQRVATFVPGVIDFLTIQKYVDGLKPVLATQRNLVSIQTALGTFQREVFAIGAAKAMVILILMIMVFLGASALSLRLREFGGDKTAGA
ncbi:MAG TPA: ABC transporter permease subunit [Candidatus Hydrogenedentes bacterium]|nr:ABC transporter permease subunit [Candidatus Hydrogenedentota bacterium]HOJ69572.1 ABC transporter permease subunit [Candidatus Hydrogenedentota bacterium]HOK89716.1 ABC transporter permease subunit [Candidatus Hydrogenedentota bacterium]HOV61158.1 ABC transporter permease subunit [Candidatus Hydrogenedentota bacterium]